MLWAEESADAVEDWWLSPRGDDDSAILDWLKQLASDVEADRFPQNYKVTDHHVERSEYLVDSPIHGVCAVLEIFDDRVLLVAILTEHPSGDDADYELP